MLPRTPLPSPHPIDDAADDHFRDDTLTRLLGVLSRC